MLGSGRRPRPESSDQDYRGRPGQRTGGGAESFRDHLEGAGVMRPLVLAGALIAAAGAPPEPAARERPNGAIVAENLREGSTDWLLFNYDQVVPGRDDVW